MDNQRVFVLAALALVLYLNYTTWQRDYAPPPAQAATSQTQTATPDASSPTDTLPDLPSETSASTQPAPKATPTPEQAVETADNQAGTVRVITDVLSLDITKRGGDVERADLLKYAQVKNHPELPVRLFNPQNPRYVAQSGLRAADKRPEPNHLAVFHADANEFQLKPG